ncbi:MAG: DNA replication/repair protein RecF [Mycobacteriales bacterium]
MRVRSLSLADFRSWHELDLEFATGVTALIGANGQGKTNIVEAVAYVASLSSHRVGTDAPLVRSGADRAVVRATVARAGRDTLVEVEINPGRANRARINRGPVPRAREVLGLLRTVVFAPEDLALVRGDPSERRRFLDELLVARTPRMSGVRADYDRVLKQRNALLKSAHLARRGAGGDMRTLDVWDAHLARAGAELLAARLRLVRALAPHVDAAYARISADQGQTALVYRGSLPAASSAEAGGDPAELAAGGSLAEPEAPSVGGAVDREVLEAALLSELARIRPQEVERGVSLVGPHRDDLLVTLSSAGVPLPVKGYASHGESWSVALALRLASYTLLRDDDPGSDGEPVLLLDDVFAELDEGRRRRLAAVVAGAEQVIVTAAVAEDVPEALEGARVDVHDGTVNRVR